ncbi:hypothetical protein AL492_17800 [Elizabethkingia anophelis]|uniref:phage portal protein family protein n=1 Tax=Elizabethkingia anophelis TaxID=1117645 RepID=UPI000CE96957|nr:DUF935 family protein [Elizabethkingia anophelis]AVF49377.1 hypothetical protein AL491_15395 [Elizabethkingia anophelis]AVF53372.1 hypothetical protein AL492_17800 [Elizabethkingia anophelis]
MNILGFNFSVKKNSVSAKSETPKSQGKKNPAIVKIVEAFKDSSRKDIDKWRKSLTATLSLEDPKFNQFHDLVDDLMTDGHLQSQIQMRKLSTLNTDYRALNRKTGEENEVLTFTLQQQWFYEFLGYALDHILKGTTLVEFQNFMGEKIEISMIPRRNVVPTRGRIYPDVLKPEFINYQDDTFKPWLIQIGKNYDLGIINNIIPNLIWKRNVMQAWAEFCEKFGLPLITATTNTTDPKVLDDVHEMLLSLGEASVGTFPPGTDIKFQEANRTDAYQVYMQFRKSNDDEISKQIIGSTMLSDQGTNRSQTEVHERNLDNRIAQADKRVLQFIVNDQLFPLLRMQGYPISEDDVFEFKTAEQETKLTELWTITSGLLTQGFPVEQDWISKTFNIPFEGKKKNLTPPNVAAAYLPENIKAPDRYGFDCTCGNHTMPISEASQSNILKYAEQLIQAIWNKEDILGAMGELITNEAIELIKGLRDGFETFNPYTGPDQLMLQMMEYNLFDFAASKTEARYATMMDLLTDGDRGIRPFNDFKRLCLEKTADLNTKYLQTEYNLSIAVGQNSASYVRFMAEKDTVTSFVQYQTVGDERVREAHQILEGKIFSLDDKEAMKLWPPNGYGCRCEMLQYVGETKGKVTTGKRGTELMYERDPKFKNSDFEINRGDLKEVFTSKQFYTENKGLDKKINSMTYDKYGLEKWEDFKDTLKPMKLDKTITPENVKDLFKKEKNEDYMGFTDYMGRKMVLPEKTFKTHTSGHYTSDAEKRHQIFPHVKDILKNPDEVWLNERNKGKYNSHYVKFYKDRAVIVNVNLNNKMEGLEIQTWYNLKRDEAKERLGLKIK